MKQKYLHIKILFIYLIVGLNLLAVQQLQIKSEILNQTRNLNIHLPVSYENSKDRYTVIYMLDGDNDNILTANAAKQLNSEGIMPKVIVVGISNINRRFDFTENAEQFLTFIKTEVIPTIDRTYRTNKKRVFKGHSLGGYFTSYVLGHSLDLFNGYYIYSPALGRASDRLFNSMKQTFKQTKKLPEFIYVSVGSNENQRFQSSYQNLTTFLKQEIPPKVKLFFETTQGADHMGNPEQSIPLALKTTWKSLQ